MKTIRLVEKLKELPIFTINDFAKILNKDSNYCKTYLYRLKKNKLIFSIEKGKYTSHDDPLIFASYITLPSYLTTLTALRIYNFTEQLPKDIFIASAKTKKTLNFNKTKIIFLKTKNIWGYKKEKYREFDIFLAEKEKSIIDSLLSKKTPFSEIIKAINSKDYNPEKLKQYALKTKNISLIKRLGYVLESTGIKAEDLRKKIDSNYIKLNPNSRKTNKKNKKWKLIINL